MKPVEAGNPCEGSFIHSSTFHDSLQNLWPDSAVHEKHGNQIFADVQEPRVCDYNFFGTEIFNMTL